MAPEKHALLLGVRDSPLIRKHPEPEIRNNYRILRCCDTDVDSMRDLLVERFGFSVDRTRTLKTREATQSAILEAAEDLIERVSDDDVVVIYYCGHGSRMRDPAEPTGMLETIVPYDTSRGPQENRDIPDLEIARWVQELNDKTPDVTLILDCCHSESVGRDGFGEAIMEAPADPRPVAELFANGRIPRLFGGTRSLKARPRLRSGWLASRHAVTIAACQIFEHSWELKLENGEGYNFHGALSYHLSRALSGLNPDATWRDVLEQVVPRVTADRPAQHPVFEGDIDQLVFGNSPWQRRGRAVVSRSSSSPLRQAPARPAPYLPLIAVDSDGVELWGGAAQDVSPGSLWTIRPHGTRRRKEGRELALVRIDRVRGTTAHGRIEEATGCLEAGQRAFLIEDQPTAPGLKVAIEAPEDRRRQVADEVSRSPLLTLAREPHSANVMVYRLAPRKTATAGDPCAYLGSLWEPSWALLGEDGLLQARLRRDDEKAIAGVIEDLVKLARFRGIRRLANPDPESRLCGRVELRILDQSGEPAEVDAGFGHVVVEAGDVIDFEIESRHDEPLWISLVELDGDHGITVLLPRFGHPTFRRGGHQLEPGDVLRVGRDYYRAAAGLEQVLPEGFPWPATEGEAQDVAISYLKLLVTTVPADFEFLEQEATRTSSPHPLGNLARLYHSNAGRRTVILPAEDVARDEDWTAIDRELGVRPRTAG